MDILEIVKEWNEIAFSRALRSRDFDLEKVISESSGRLVSISGIRRAGKSSLLMLLHRKLISMNHKSAYVNMEDDRLKFETALDGVLKSSGDAEWLLLDEVTNAKRWVNWLHRINEMKVPHLIVSSSLNALSTAPPKPLRGRVSVFELFPLSFKEFLEFSQQEQTPAKTTPEQLGDFLLYGGFPEVTASTNKVQLLQEYFNSIVSLDVSNLSEASSALVADFARQLVETPLFSASKMEGLMKELGYKTSKEQMLKLERRFHQAYLAFFVPIFSNKVKNEKRYARKVYMGDTGFHYAVTGKKSMGKLYENAVFLHLRRSLPLLEKICYYSSREGYEVDFLIRSGAAVHKLVQVCYSLEDDKTAERELRALLTAANEFNLDGKNGELLVVTSDREGTETIEGKLITFKKLEKWLLE